jgi:BirA family biotin operon repressor/biotin-[acetyl-CoA-carboxylase] ligase
LPKLRDFTLEEISVLAEVGSTNDEARKRLQQKSSVLVVAEAQRWGRGRGGRKWESPPGGLWFSLGFREILDKRNPSLIPILTGVAVAEGLRVLGFTARIKWPNDILIKGKKVAGVLVEADTGESSDLVIGIGINLNMSEKELQERVKETEVGTLMEFAGRPLDRDEVLIQVLKEFFDLWALWKSGHIEPARERFGELCSTLNRPVKVLDRWGGLRIKGIAVGLSRDGALLVRGWDGQLHRVVEGRILHDFPNGGF